MSRAACGTVAAYNLHRRLGEETCAECRAAWAAYIREFRSRGTWFKGGNNARGRALTRIAQRHWDEYQALYAEELGKEREAAS